MDSLSKYLLVFFCDFNILCGWYHWYLNTTMWSQCLICFMQYSYISVVLLLSLWFEFIFYFFSIFFSIWLLSVLRGHSVFSSPPQRPITSDFEGFSIPDFIHYIYFPILILEKEPVIFPLECSVLNKGTTGTIFITSLVWRGPWLGIEPGTSLPHSKPALYH